MNCFYCDKILSDKILIRKIIEDKNLLVFYHTNPSYEFHVVIVFKKHISTIFDFKDNKLLFEIFETIKQIIKKKNLEKKGFRIITNGGAYQDEKHLHFHLVSGKRIKHESKRN